MADGSGAVHCRFDRLPALSDVLDRGVSRFGAQHARAERGGEEVRGRGGEQGGVRFCGFDEEERVVEYGVLYPVVGRDCDFGGDCGDYVCA